MHETNEDRQTAADPLARIVRAAGRRAAPPKAHYDEVYAAVHATWQSKLARRRQRNWYALAATLALAVAGAALWQTFSIQSSPPAGEFALLRGQVEQYSTGPDLWRRADPADARLDDGARIRTGDDGTAALWLADGGSLRLDTNTELVLHAASLELERGRVYFDSAGRRARMPIDVVTELGTIRDIGTQFEVQSVADTLRVRIRSGSIALLDSNVDAPVAGASGEEIEVSATGQLSRREFARDDPQWRWAQNLAVAPDYDAPSVLRYLTWIAAETGRTLDFESETVRLQAELVRFLGDARDLTPTQLLATIEATSQFGYEMTDHGSILISRKPDAQ